MRLISPLNYLSIIMHSTVWYTACKSDIKIKQGRSLHLLLGSAVISLLTNVCSKSHLRQAPCMSVSSLCFCQAPLGNTETSNCCTSKLNHAFLYKTMPSLWSHSYIKSTHSQVSEASYSLLIYSSSFSRQILLALKRDYNPPLTIYACKACE